MELTYRLNTLTAQDFIHLRQAAGWEIPQLQQVERSLANSLVTVAAMCDGQVVGMARLVGDLAVICYAQDVIVLPQVQGNGIGKQMLEHLEEFIRQNALPGTRIKLGLFAAKGKDGFYEKQGFSARPSQQTGPGMEKLLDIPLRD